MLLHTAVRKVLQGKKRIEQDSFHKFRAYYSFESRFCNPGNGHEKGGVEGMVGFVRRNYMVPIPEVASLEELNDRLLDSCSSYGSHTSAGRDKSVDLLFEEEVPSLLSLTAIPFSNIQIQGGKVDTYATVMLDKNRYSVPSRYAGYPVKVQLSVDQISLHFETKKIAEHTRLFNNNKWSLKPEHYLELIQQRPQSFESARPLAKWRDQWPENLNKLLIKFQEKVGTKLGIKDFINVLMFYQEYSKEAVEEAVTVALDQGICCSGGVQHILIYTHSPERIIPLIPGWEQSEIPDLSVYAPLGGVQ